MSPDTDIIFKRSRQGTCPNQQGPLKAASKRESDRATTAPSGPTHKDPLRACLVSPFFNDTAPCSA